VCSQWPREDLEIALLITSELVTNAVLHGAGQIQLSVACEGDLLEVDVTDGGSSAVRFRDATDPLAESGRGLEVVNALADRWGVRSLQEAPGKVVWFQMRARTIGDHAVSS
jgi:anti-sigma regulatory factor (Ser/Thr protein kinase)